MGDGAHGRTDSGAPRLRVALCSRSEEGGGAARAAHRLLDTLTGAGVVPRLIVMERETSSSASVAEGGTAVGRVTARCSRLLQRLQRTPNRAPHSSNLLPTGFAIPQGTDVVNLHWVGGGTMSIEEIGQIRTPVVMTLHDMWGFCGAEHYAPDNDSARWVTGYRRDNRLPGHRGMDLDRWTWTRKRRSWNPMQLVTPSTWLAGCVKRSALMSDWPVTVIPNPLDLTCFRPRARHAARVRLGLPPGRSIVLAGAMGVGTDRRKGFDLLVDAWSQLDMPDVLLVVFGGLDSSRGLAPDRTRWVGRVDDDDTLADLYSAADLMIVPSRQENLPQTATEAQACGTPVLGFDTTGMPDAVADGNTGMLVEPFDTAALADGVRRLLARPGKLRRLGIAARERARKVWAPDVVAKQYIDVYGAALDDECGRS